MIPAMSGSSAPGSLAGRSAFSRLRSSRLASLSFWRCARASSFWRLVDFPCIRHLRKKSPASERETGLENLPAGSLGYDPDVLGLQALGPLLHVELDLLAFAQRA